MKRLISAVILIFTLISVIHGQDIINRHGDAVIDLAWNPTGSLLGMIYANGKVEVHNSTEIIFEFQADIEFDLYRAKLAWSNSGDMLAIGIGSYIYFWDASILTIVKEIQSGSENPLLNIEGAVVPESVVSLGWNTSGTKFMSHSESAQLKIWSYPDLKLLFSETTGNVALPQIWLPNDFQTTDGESFFDLQTYTFSAIEKNIPNIIRNNLSTIVSISLSSNGEKIATGTYSGYLEIADATSGDVLHIEKYVESAITGIAWSNDNSHVVIIGQNGYIAIVNIDTGVSELIGEVQGDLYTVDIRPVTQEIVVGGISDNGSTLIQSIIVTELSPAIPLTELDGATNISESGQTDNYALALTTPPSADVIVNVSADAAQRTKRLCAAIIPPCGVDSGQRRYTHRQVSARNGEGVLWAVHGCCSG
jgi:WD40 repeat protein